MDKEALVCRVCKTLVPIESMVKNATIAYGYSRTCKPCLRIYGREYRRKNKETMAATHRRHKLKQQYGMAPGVLKDLLKAQDNLCKICLTKPDDEKGLVVDHCHVSGMVRGMLCTKCNTGLGMFRDDEIFLEKAILYLKSARGKTNE